MSTPQPPVLLDFGNAPDIFCSGLAQVDIGDPGIGCFILYRNVVLGNGEIERQVVAKILMPLSAVPEAVELALAAVGQTAIIRAVQSAKRMLS